MKNINGASIILTEQCNLNCQYCYEKNKHNNVMDESVLKKSIDFLANNNLNNNLKIIWFGGEPLLQLDLLNYGIKYLKSKNIDFKHQIITNGTIWNDSVKSLMEINPELSIQVSWDGMPEFNDIQRGNTEVVEKNIQNISKLKNSLSVHICITPLMVDKLFENVKYIINSVNRNNNFKITLRPVPEMEGWNKEKLNKFKQQYLMCCEQYSEYIDKLINCDYYFDHIGTCGAGKNFATISPKGDIYACHRFYFNNNSQQFKLGDVNNGFIESNMSIKLEEYTVDDIEKCLECDCYQFCDRCIAENFQMTGDLLTPSNIRCKIYTQIFQSILDYMIKYYPEKLQNYDKDTNIVLPIGQINYDIPLIKVIKK